MALLDIFRKKKIKTETQKKAAIKEKKEGVKQLKVEKSKKLEKKKEVKRVRPAKAKEASGLAYRVLIRPLITEKATDLSANNQYVFQVSVRAKKQEIKAAIVKVYGVQPLKVNVCHFKGKAIRYGRVSGRTKHWKKAIITLKPGDKIETMEGV